MVLALELADVGIGAVMGAIISGTVVLILDQRRRSEDKKTRFLAERRQSYNTFLRHADLVRDDIQLIAAFVLLLGDTKPEGATKITPGDLNPEAGKLGVLLVDRLTANLTRYQEQVIESMSTHLALLWPESAQRAGQRVLETLTKMGAYLGNPPDVLANLDVVELSNLATLDDEYDRARARFVAAVRRDLGVGPRT